LVLAIQDITEISIDHLEVDPVDADRGEHQRQIGK
jgi:hypothetical protein